jgi:glucan phosphoethanolaminetransferase (alkaline phosphatase superfamily)
LDPDLLFLIPLPWWGPVLSPLLIALLMAVVGALMSSSPETGVAFRFTRTNLAILLIGVLVILYAFMADALALLPADAQTLSQVKPGRFNWPVYLIGYIIGLTGILRSMRPLTSRLKQDPIKTNE